MDKFYIVYAHSCGRREGGRQEGSMTHPPIAIRRTVFQVSGALSTVLALAQYVVVVVVVIQLVAKRCCRVYFYNARKAKRATKERPRGIP